MLRNNLHCLDFKEKLLPDSITVTQPQTECSSSHQENASATMENTSRFEEVIDQNSDSDTPLSNHNDSLMLDE